MYATGTSTDGKVAVFSVNNTLAHVPKWLQRSAGASFLGLSGRGTVAFLDDEILRYAKLIAALNQEGSRN